MTQPSYTDILGYDPSAGAPSAYGIGSRDQWVATIAATWHLQYTNGMELSGGWGPGGLFSNEFVDSIGINFRLNPADLGIATRDGTPDPQTYQMFVRMAEWVFDNYDSLPQSIRQQILAPTTPSGQKLPDTPYLSEEDKDRIWRSTEAEKDRDTRIQIANIDADAARDVANIQADSAREVANIRAAVDRESIAAQERIAAADRESRERIAQLEEEGRNRRFDLELAEERRQFNANMMVSLLQTGVELMRRPVDWLAYQFYMENLSIPLTTMNFGAMASLLGAVPPSGPSEAGPVVGGPAVLDGDLRFAEAAGVQNPGLVSVQEAVQANPGQSREVASLTAANTLPQLAEQAGGLDQLERMVAQARVTALPGAVQDSDLMRRELQRQQEVLARVAPQALDRDMRGEMPAVPQTEEAQSMRRIAQAVGDQAWGDQAWAREPGAPPADLPPVPGTQYRDILKQAWEPDSPWEMVDYRPAAPGTPTTSRGLPPGTDARWLQMGPGTQTPNLAMDDLTPAARRTQTPNLAMDDFVNLDGMAPATGPQYRIDPTATPLQTPTGGNRGVYTGETATAPTGAQPTGAQAPQGAALIDQIAGLLGIPREQVQQLIPPHLLAGGYSAETIANSPVVKAIRDQQQLSFYRTAPADGEKFGQIQAFGIPLGIRSGQDLNAGVYLRAPRSGQEQIQGAIESTGQYWPDALEQSLRASPVSNYDIGAFGSRRF